MEVCDIDVMQYDTRPRRQMADSLMVIVTGRVKIFVPKTLGEGHLFTLGPG